MPTKHSINLLYPGLQWQDADNCEANRLASYVDWGNDHVSCLKLAATGFLYTGVDDKVICYFCSFTYENWTHGQNPSDVHQRGSPNCPMFTGVITDTTKPNVNFPLDGGKDALSKVIKSSLFGIQESDAQKTTDNDVNTVCLHPVQDNARDRSQYFCLLCEISQTATVKTEKGLYEQYSSERQRLNTFCSFPLRDEPLRSKLCSNGFFYTGYGDLVFCHYCGLGLYDWKPKDDPKIAHAGWSPDCNHLRSVVTPEFISAMQREIRNVGNGE